MTGKELKQLVDSGIHPVIEFTEYIEDLECRFEKGMRAYIVGVNVVYEKEIEIILEEKDFAEYNKSMEKPQWRKDFDGEYIYKYSELQCHQNWNGTENIGEMLDEELINLFIVNNKRLELFRQYQSENLKIRYFEWLEDKVLNYK